MHLKKKTADSYSTLDVMRVLSFMMAVNAKPLVADDDMCDCKTVSKASRTSSSVILYRRTKMGIKDKGNLI